MEDLKSKYNLKYLWFAGKDGWQVTSFDPREDTAIKHIEDHELYVDFESYKKLRQIVEVCKEALNKIDVGFGGMFGTDTKSFEQDAFEMIPEIIKQALEAVAALDQQSAEDKRE